MSHAAPARYVPSATRTGLYLLRGLLAAVLVAAVAPPGASQLASSEGPEVDAVKQALNAAAAADKDNFVERFRDLERKVERLRRLNLMFRAALLPEWDPFLPVMVDPEVWGRERNRVLGGLIARVEKRVGTLVAQPNPPLQVGLLTLLRTESETARSGSVDYDRTGVRRKLLNDLAPAVIEAAFDPNEDVRIAAILTLGQRFGKPGPTVEAYRKALAGDTVSTRRAVTESLDTFVAVSTKKQADLTLSQQGEILRLLLPVLNTTLGDKDVLVRRRGANVLVKLTKSLVGELRPIDPQLEVPPLPEPMRKDDKLDPRNTPEERRAYLALVREMGPELNRLAGQLEKAMTDPDPVVRALSLAIIEQFAAIRSALQPAPPEADRGKDARAPAAGRVEVVPAAFLGTPVAQDPELPAPNKSEDVPSVIKATLPTLRTGLTDANVRVRLFALDAIERLGDVAEPLVPDLVAAVSDPDPFVRWAAARCLRGLAPRRPAEVVPALAKLLAERDPDIRIAALRALTAYEAAAVSTLPALVEQVKRADPNVRTAAITLLNQFGEAAAPAVPALIDNLRHDDAKVRRAAAEALGLLGSRAAAGNAALRQLTSDPNQDVRREAAIALYRINQPDPEEKPQPRENDPRDR